MYPMTEGEWLLSDDPLAMLRHLGSRLNERRQAAWVVACQQAFYGGNSNADFLKANLPSLVRTWANGNGVRTDEVTLPLAVRAGLLRDVAGNPYRPVSLCQNHPDPYHRSCTGNKCPEHQESMRHLLTWHDATIPHMARTIHAGHDWAAMPVLADALEEAGCDCAELLLHLRGWAPCPTCLKLPDEVNHPPGMLFVGWGMGWQPCSTCEGAAWLPGGPHCRGCWALALLTPEPPGEKTNG